MLRFKGSTAFRWRIIFATLSGQEISIEGIRAGEAKAGLRSYETNFLKAVERVCSGCEFTINYTGTRVHYKPGIVIGGRNITHNCGESRSMGYAIEGLLLILPFAKKPTTLLLHGITNGALDASVDMVREVMFPVLKRFGIDDGLSLKVERRGPPPLGGGTAILTCPVVPSARPVQLIKEGLVKKVRGIAYTAHVPPQTAMRVITSARRLINKFIPDVHIDTDPMRGKEGGRSPGFGLFLVAETTTGGLISAEGIAASKMAPEDLGTQVAKQLLDEVKKGGSVDTFAQPLTLGLMALTSEDVSQVRLGKLSPISVEILRLIQTFLGVRFKIDANPKTHTLLLTCVGSGFKSASRRAE